MLKKIILTGAVFSLSACISIEAPDNLVSDTIEAGKDVYNSVKDKMSDKESDNTKMFTHQYLVPEGELIGESSGKCIELAIDSARKSLNVYNVEVEESSAKHKTLEGQPAVECSIVVGIHG